MTKRVRDDVDDDERRTKRKGKSKLLEQYKSDEESQSIANSFKKKAKSNLLDQEMMPAHNQLKQNDFFKGLIENGISVQDVEKLQAAAVYSCHDLLNQTKKNLRIKDLSVHQIRKICEAAKELVNDGHDTANDDKIKVKFVGDLRKPMKSEEKGDKPKQKHYVFVSNLSKKVKDKDLKKQFKEFGKVEHVVIIPQGDRPMNYGFIYFYSKQAAAKALIMNGSPFKGEPIHVEPGRRVVFDLDDVYGRHGRERY